jgi:hypothetical protein
MTEPSQPAAEPSKRSYKDLCGIAIGILVFPALVFAARRTGIWPRTLLGFVIFGIPCLLIGFRSWNRWSHPDRLPVRWTQDHPRGHRLQTLDRMLAWIWVVGWFARLVTYQSKHHTIYITLSLIAGAAVSWHAFLADYITDHKYIPPTRPPNDFSPWARIYKPLQSERWGEAGAKSSKRSS